MPFHGGLDWGATSHAACVVDGAGQIVARVEARHDAGGLAELLARLRAVAPPAELPVAIERPSGLIVDALVAAGHPVVPIHPNVVKACRPRYRAAGGKSDPGDAYMLADILRTDGHRFRPLVPVSDEIKALRALVRARDDLVTQRVALANQLRSLLEGFWPGAAAIFAPIDSPIPFPARSFLAGGGGDLPRHRQPDRARLRRPLPDPGERGPPRREAPRQLHGPARLLRATLGGRAAGPLAGRPDRLGRRGRGGGQRRDRARPGRPARTARRRDRQAVVAHRAGRR